MWGTRESEKERTSCMMRFGKRSVWCSLPCELFFFLAPFFVLLYLLLGFGWGACEVGRRLVVCGLLFCCVVCCVWREWGVVYNLYTLLEIGWRDYSIEPPQDTMTTIFITYHW